MGLGTGRGAGGARTAQGNAPKAPRMAQEGLAGPTQPLCPSPAPEPVLGHPWKPEALSGIPAGSAYRMLGTAEMERHLAARRRFLDAVAALSEAKRREFPAYKYGESVPGAHVARARLLVDFGGLPETVEYLTEVPAEVLEAAVAQFIDCFGLGAAEHPVGSRVGLAAELDSAPRHKDVPEDAPW